MTRKKIVFSVFVLAAALASQITGCSIFSGPSDEEVIKAVSASPVFSGTNKGFTLQSPILLVEKGWQAKDGSWPVKVKLTFTFMRNGQTSAPTETTARFKIFRSKDNTGKVYWRAELGSW